MTISLFEASNTVLKSMGSAACYARPQTRDYQPIRRHSYLKGREGVFWRSMRRKEARQIVFAARKYELTTRGKGERNGALGGVALEVLDYFANLMDYRTGRLEPSIETLKAALHRSRDAIVRALKALRTHGFLDWIRRYVPADDPHGRVKVQQTSNAYRLFMPNRALKLLGRYGQKPPMPDDEAHRMEEQAATFEKCLSELSLAEKAHAMITHDKLAESLAKLGASIEKRRESAKQTESLSKDNLYRVRT